MQFGGRPRRKTGLQTASTSNNTTTVSPLTAKLSYEDATATCRAKVSKIVRECCRINKKYRDPHFDLETDLKLRRRDCLQSISCSREDTKLPGSDFNPQSAKRVVDIFDKPQFFIDGPTADNVKQGRDGDCWLMSALCNLSSKKGLIESLCVAHDQDVGVYGFVFFRDGEWISEIVDDFVGVSYPSLIPPSVALSRCSTSIFEPGRYLLAHTAILTPANYPGCLIPVIFDQTRLRRGRHRPSPLR